MVLSRISLLGAGKVFPLDLTTRGNVTANVSGKVPFAFRGLALSLPPGSVRVWDWDLAGRRSVGSLSTLEDVRGLEEPDKFQRGFSVRIKLSFLVQKFVLWCQKTKTPLTCVKF